MSVIEELQTAVAAVAERVGPSIVGIGRGTRGSGVVIADGKVLTNAHNLRGDEVTVTFADGRRDARHRGRLSTATATSRSSTVDTAGADAARLGRRRRARRSGPPSSGPRPATAAGRASRSGSSRRSPGPSAARVAGASTGSVEHTAPLAPGLVRWRARRRGGPAGRAQHEPDRRGLLPRAPGRRRAARRGSTPWLAASRRAGRGSASPSRRSHVARRLRRSVGLPERDGVLVRGVEDGSPAAAAGIEAGDLIVEAGGTPDRPTPTTCYAALGAARARRSRSSSCAAPRSGPSRSAAPKGGRPATPSPDSRGRRAVTVGPVTPTGSADRLASGRGATPRLVPRSPRRSAPSSRWSSRTSSRSSGSCSSAGASGRS